MRNVTVGVAGFAAGVLIAVGVIVYVDRWVRL